MSMLNGTGMLGYRRLVGTFELEPIQPCFGDSLRFRVEVFGQNGGYTVRLARWESIRAQPSFPSNADVAAIGTSDFEVLVSDDSIDLSGVDEPSIEEALSKTIEVLRAQLLHA
ncbi:hypothetical protein [Tahibacter amnicola]|uniref:Uncharacterized protein n=1 Tax=Tahibacter amnicola TaxID=2976241 RepID=A0ABY6BGR8_9GAMM|nr:hypothetical protein [Tahibacter amnicola]UXI67062.1 hypothetical protein N4264_20255 [Tahibacter amnicola]